MTKLRTLAMAALAVVVTQSAWADVWNKKTKLTFSGPVRLPGIVLPAGSYVFRLAESQSNRNIVQVFNQEENKILATVLTISDYRLNPTSKTVMYFTESNPGTPPAVKSWFYPGDNYGKRFVYPRSEATTMAASFNQPVPSYEGNLTDNTAMMGAKVDVTTPTNTTDAYSEKSFESYDVKDTAGVMGEPVQENTGNTSSATSQTNTVTQQPSTTTQQPTTTTPRTDDSYQNRSADTNRGIETTRTTREELPRTSSPMHATALAGLAALGVAALSRKLAGRG